MTQLNTVSWSNYCCLLMLIAILLAITDSNAQERVPQRLAGDKLFAAFDKKAKAERNISGITCRANGVCVVVADEMIAVQALSLSVDDGSNTYAPGAHFGTLFHEDCKSVKKRKGCSEVDLEAIAQDNDNIFLSGSMGNASKSGNIAQKRWFLAKFAIADDGTAVPETLLVQKRRKVLKAIFSQHPDLAPYVEKPLQCGGLNVEGLAIIKDQLFFGLRSPANRPQGEAILVQLPTSILSVRKKSDVETTILHHLRFLDRNGKQLKNTGIRALEEINGKILIATGSSGVGAPRSFDHLQDIRRKCADVLERNENLNVADDLDPAPRIWIWDPKSGGDPRELVQLGGEYSDEKLEGLAVLGTSVNGSVDLLLAIDSPDTVGPLGILRHVELE